jgi:predicted metal-binding membrane protein
VTGESRAASFASTVTSERTVLAATALLFVASTGGTVWWCGSMSGGMAMPGGWTMSMAWMRMPDQTWPEAAASFLAMWALMMLAMMLPSLALMLAPYYRDLSERDEPHAVVPTVIAGAAYFVVWTIVGAAVYPLGIVLAAAAMGSDALARCIPVATGVVLVLAGCLQLTAWKSRALARCRDVHACGMRVGSDPRSAWAHGGRLGVHCSLCCSGLVAGLLVVGVMDVGAMALVATAITAERFAPKPAYVARTSGMLLVAAGLLAIARVAGI